MTDKREMLSEIELEQWVGALDSFDVEEGTEEIDGVRVSVCEDSSLHSGDVSMSMTLVDYGIELRREGRKVVSYGRWVDTDWGSWSR